MTTDTEFILEAKIMLTVSYAKVEQIQIDKLCRCFQKIIDLLMILSVKLN